MPERVARDVAEVAGIAIADAAVWFVYRPLGLALIGAALVAGARWWRP